MLHKTHKPNIPIRLLTTRCNAAVENLAIFIEKHCGKLTENIPTKVNGSYHLIDIFEAWNAKGIPDHGILVSFDIVNMFPSIANTRGVAAVRSDLNSRTNLSPSTKYILEALEIVQQITTRLSLLKILYKQMEQQCVQLTLFLIQIWQFSQSIKL